MKTGTARGTRALAVAALGTLVLVAGAAGSATATDIEALRTRAQDLGNQVSGLEHDLAGLNDRKARLSSEIARASAELGSLEAQAHDVEDAYRVALDRYVERAVAAYKSGPSGDLALLLSARTMDDLFAAAEVSAHSAAQDGDAVDDLVSARSALETSQQRIDDRKQRLLAKHTAVESVTSEIEWTIAARREVLADLTAEIRRLEQQARIAAARAADPDASFLDLLQPSGPAPGIPNGFAGTGVSFSGVASWYGPGFEGNSTANGDIFDSDLFTAASRDLPFGTWLYVTHESRGVVVLVNDRGPYIDGRVLDLSRAAAQAIGISGIGWVEAEILIKAR